MYRGTVMGSPPWLEVWVQRLSQGPMQSASCRWPWWKEVGKRPCDTSWVTEGGGQQTQAPTDISDMCVRADLCLGW